MDIPKDFLSKEFLSQFKTQEDVEAFMSEFHVKVYEQMLQSEVDSHLGYEKGSKSGINSGNSRNGSYPKKIQGKHGQSVIEVPRDREGGFEPIVVPKHQSRGLSIERLVISLYAKGMSVSDIESEMYEVNLSASAISHITNKVSHQAIEWQNRPLDNLYLIVWMALYSKSEIMARLSTRQFTYA
ncbi:transposase (fragment) [uncultured Dysgonomonas sp.]|uniref:Mutator family transposase n=1 Tax=uncultured Dysgonomonas sp. TaxID=206096 RepID=A0A212J7U2_9BACT